MIEGVVIEREGDRFQLRLRGDIDLASSDGELEIRLKSGVAFRLDDQAAADLLAQARDVIGPWNEIRTRVAEEYASHG